MKLKYEEYLEDKEEAINKALQNFGTEGVRLYPTLKAARRDNVHNCTTLHEYFLRKTNDREGVIVVDEPCMISDTVLGCFLSSLDENKKVLFIQNAENANTGISNKVINALKE